MTLPMTLAIIPALIVSIAERTYALPSNVLETIALADVRIKTIERREVISVRGATVPLVDLRDLFGRKVSARVTLWRRCRDWQHESR